MQNTNWIKLLIISAIFVLGIFAGAAWRERGLPLQSSILNASVSPDRKPDPAHKLINPLLECEYAENSFHELRPFNDKVEKFIQENILTKNSANFVAVYFRDLNNGPWFGINEKEDFSPASLLKVPVMLAYFRQAERDPGILNKKHVYNPGKNAPVAQQYIKPIETLEAGKTYTVDNLIYRMIAYSDNASQSVLLANVDMPTFIEVYNDFGIPIPSEKTPVTQIDVQTYSKFFRVLFNASYLSREYSEKALEILEKSEFKDGLAAGVPKGIPIANKFGERQLVNEKQLHDCGIVYYPDHPYMLCIMSRGGDINELAKTIRDISGYVYREFDVQFRSN